MAQKKDHTFKLNLLDNGIDFILKGIDELFGDENFITDIKIATQFSSEDLKYGCLHIFAGFLLILKERLARHAPELIYKGRLPEIRRKIEQGLLPNTVDFDELLERLEIGPRVTFSNNELKILRKMQDWRNRFEHGEVEVNKYEIWQNLSEFLDLVDEFLVNELEIKLEESVEGYELSNKIKKIDHAWHRTEEDWKRQELADLQSRLSEFKRRKKEILTEIELHEPGLGPDFLICAECGEESLLASGEFEGICINCESVTCLTDCARCGEPRLGFHWDPDFCESCKDYIAGE